MTHKVIWLYRLPAFPCTSSDRTNSSHPVHLISEKKELRKMVEGLVWYSPTEEELRRYGSGGVAIIDQWITSHAQFFIGKIHQMTRNVIPYSGKIHIIDQNAFKINLNFVCIMRIHSKFYKNLHHSTDSRIPVIIMVIIMIVYLRSVRL